MIFQDSWDWSLIQKKSHVILLGVDYEMQTSLQTLLGFRLGSLLVRYLGIPLITTHLKHNDCLLLVQDQAMNLNIIGCVASRWTS
jgi:hypothetical protein